MPVVQDKALIDMSDFFTDKVENYKAEIVENIFNQLIEETPVKTGTLRASWDHGISRETSIPPVGEYTIPNKVVLPRNSNINWETYHIWNNQPYAGAVNDSEAHFSFIERAIFSAVVK